jgi:hypothetical protein
MKPRIFCGYVLIALFIAVLGYITVFPGTSTQQQESNAVRLALIAVVIGAALIAYEKHAEKKENKQYRHHAA